MGDLMAIRIVLMILLLTGSALAQRGGRGGGEDGPPIPVAQPSVLDKMVTACNLSKDQKKQFKTLLDAASKSAEPLRKQIPASLQLIGTAAVSGKNADELKRLMEENGEMRARLSELEYKTFGELYNLLTPDQRKGPGGQRLFNLTSGILMKKNWNE
jgi:Spy/CpxP family protein refolding chaperone